MVEDQYYYSKHPQVASDPISWTFMLLKHNIQFTSDNGVFSKRRVDYGTRVLIDNVNFESIPSGKILDLGAGYGPIGLAIAKAFPKRSVEMVDVNEIALNLAKRNAAANQIKNVSIYQSDVYQNVTNNFAAVITNPPVRAGKTIVEKMIRGAGNHLISDGQLWVVLQKKQGAPSAKKLMTKVFGNCEIIKRDKGYYVLKSVK